MQKLTLLICLFITLSFSYSQSSTCDGARYKSIVFTDIDSTMAIQYGNSTTIGGNNQNLLMDIYYPKNDIAVSRPIVVFAHGGSFIGGDRSEMIPLCRLFASQGYTAATISYRLLDVFVTDSVSLVDEVIKATHDMKAAIRYFREDASNSNVFKVDTNFIFAGGVSAGGLMASHVGYLQMTDNIPAYIQTVISNNGGIEGTSSNNTQYSSKVFGVLNYSGALGRAHWIDSNDPPLYSAHDDGDGVVLCGNGLTPGGSFLQITTDGSCTMEPAANAAGITNSFYEITGSSDHVSYFANGVNADGLAILQQSSDFLHDIICTSVGVEEVIKNNQLELFPNPATNNITLKPQIAGSYAISIFTTTGQLVDQKNELNGSVNYNVSQLKQGVYIVKATFENNTITISKLVKE